MEKILNKSKSRYFFGGKKKGVKDQGISSSDISVALSDDRSEGHGVRSTLPHTTPRMFQADESVTVPSAPWMHHSRNSPEANAASEYSHFSKRRIGNPVSALELRSQDFGPPSHSRFEVHISPTAFSPIMMPSSTPPRNLDSPPASAPPQRLEFPREHRTVDSSRVGDIHAHSRSQSALIPLQLSSSHGRNRRQGIPEAFMDGTQGTARETQHLNVQNVGAERYISDSFRNTSTSSDTSLVHPSASAPTTSHFSRPHDSLGISDFAPLRGSSTVPIMSAHSPLPRSHPSYNLAALTPTSSATPPSPTSPIDASPRVSPRSHHVQPSRESDRPRREPPPPPHSASHTTASENHTGAHSHSNHHANRSMNSDKEIGYKGLAFPLPPSNEGMSYSSSQSSLYSNGSGRKAGEIPATPKKTREGKEERHAKTPSAGVGSERSAQQKVFRTSEEFTSPTHRRHRDPDASFGSNPKIDRERETTGNAPERARNVSLTAPIVESCENGPDKRSASHIRATSEAIQRTSDPSRQTPQPPLVSEPTKPLSVTPARRALHTARSFSTGLNDRKQLHPSASNRDLSSSFNNTNSRSEWNSTPHLPLPPQRDVPNATSQSDKKSPIKPRFTLPTPPHSSSALASVAKGQEHQSGPLRSPTLEDVTNALQTQHHRFDELAGYVLNVAQKHAAERDAYVGRVGHLETTVAKMESEIRGLRWLMMEHLKPRAGAIEEPASAAAKPSGGDDTKQKLRRSITMPQLAPIPPHRPKHARSKRDAIGLGLGFSPDSVLSSSATSSPPAKENVRQPPPDEGDDTPSMDEIIDKLMGVRQWANADVRVSIVDTGAGDGDSKKIVFKERRQ